MKRHHLILSLILLSTLSSCVYSLFPMYTEDTVVFKEDLLGKWVSNDDGSYILFEQVVVEAEVKESQKELNNDQKESVILIEEKSYNLSVVNNKDSVKEEYLVHLVDLDGDLFMDLYPVSEFNSRILSDNYFPVHTFYKVKVDQDNFTMIPFDLEKLNKLFESNLIRLRHENVEGTVLITAQPKELQKFIDRYSDDETVFDTPEVYTRVL